MGSSSDLPGERTSQAGSIVLPRQLSEQTQNHPCPDAVPTQARLADRGMLGHAPATGMAYGRASTPEGAMTAGGPGEFGERLRRYRSLVGLTQEALAERAGLSVRGIADLERGARRFPR